MDEPTLLPDKFRASLDPTDERGFALLRENDEKQKKLGAKIGSPFSSPREMLRQKAKVRIATLAQMLTMTDEIKESLAESYATLGMYDVAASVSVARSDKYQQYWRAVTKDDDLYCTHPDKHIIIAEWIFSMKHGKDMPLFRCVKCDFENVRAN